MENQEQKSNYKVCFSETAQRVAIIDKRTGEDVETFNDNIPEGLLIQRMLEIREDELFRGKLTAGIVDSNSKNGSIVMPGDENVITGGNLIL